MAIMQISTIAESNTSITRDKKHKLIFLASRVNKPLVNISLN